MKERAKELKAAEYAEKDKVEGESAVLAKIDELSEPERSMVKHLHLIIKINAPVLTPKLWYGMPAYAKNGKIACSFQSAVKFKTRYVTSGFQDPANLDEGVLWPVAFALNKLTADVELRYASLVKKAVR